MPYRNNILRYYLGNIRLTYLFLHLQRNDVVSLSPAAACVPEVVLETEAQQSPVTLAQLFNSFSTEPEAPQIPTVVANFGFVEDEDETVTGDYDTSKFAYC